MVSLRRLAATWTIGPGWSYTMPSQVSALVSDGDTVNIEAGIYHSDVARWQADDLVLRGVGGFAHLESNGLAWGGKAIWVIQGDNTTVEWIEFSECQVPDHDGAGIPAWRELNLTVRHCWFHTTRTASSAENTIPARCVSSTASSGTMVLGMATRTTSTSAMWTRSSSDTITAIMRMWAMN
ncbi:MAG: hypothetical protein IPF41_17410 [Flavobacteriales bacterium]|nr:hypothetical protein [Flavobacteriales bacterium]